MNETIGMILCGGFGKRLRPVTETIPKPLVEQIGRASCRERV